MIEYASFGKLVFEGKVYRSDCIIEGKKINSRWWRKEGNKLSIDDIEDVVREKPEAVVIGIGFVNLLDVQKSAVTELEGKGIEVIIEKTDKAVEIYNKLDEGKKVIGIFHLV